MIGEDPNIYIDVLRIEIYRNDTVRVLEEDPKMREKSSKAVSNHARD